MLRLNPTQLRLDARDLSWHVGRLEERQASRAKVPPTDVTKKSRSLKKKQQGDSHTQALPYPSSNPPAANSPHIAAVHEGSIISNEPVPKNSRSFWDRILAEAGTPTRTQATSQGSAAVFDPSDDFLENNQSSRVSIEDEHTLAQDSQTNQDSEVSAGEGLRSPSLDSEAETTFQQQNPFLSPSTFSKELKDEKIVLEDHTISAECRDFDFFHRKPKYEMDDTSKNDDHLVSDDMQIDGHCDAHSGVNESSSRSSSTSLRPDFQDGLYGSRRDRRTISSNLEAYVNRNSDTEGYGFMRWSRELPIRSALPQQTSQSIEELPRHASGLPRSSLHISQAAVSSSPHKRESTPVHNGTAVPERSGLLAYPPRRRVKYKPRSESYPFEASEDMDNTALPQLDGQFTDPTMMTTLPSLTVSYPSIVGISPQSVDQYSTHASPVGSQGNYIPSSPPGMPTYLGYSDHTSPSQTQIHIGSSPRSNSGHGTPIGARMSYTGSSPPDFHGEEVEIRSYRSLSSIGSHYTGVPSSHDLISNNRPTPSPRNLSPYAAPFVPRSARRNLSPQLPLPPPFSATPRNVSLSYTLPSSSVSPRTPPSRQASYTTKPSPHSPAHLTGHLPVNYDNLPAPTQPQTPSRPAGRIPVYNDNLPASTQPQTPAGLRRHGLPPMATQNPFNTAPARAPGLGGRNAGVADRQAFATPTRGPSGRRRRHVDEEQENVGMVDEEERRLRREGWMSMRMGREEMGRHGER